MSAVSVVLATHKQAHMRQCLPFQFYYLPSSLNSNIQSGNTTQENALSSSLLKKSVVGNISDVDDAEYGVCRSSDPRGVRLAFTSPR